MKPYTIVEFSDGIEMVPTDWLSEDQKSCIWPEMKNQIRINTAIANMEMPDSQNKSTHKWATYNVLKIFGSADTYESGKDKLKLAEQLSDLGSDAASGVDDPTTALKKTRHSRAVKNQIYSSDDEEQEKNYPEVPKSLGQGSRLRISEKSSVIGKAGAGSVREESFRAKSTIEKDSLKDGTKTGNISNKTRESRSNRSESPVDQDSDDENIRAPERDCQRTSVKPSKQPRENGTKTGITSKNANRDSTQNRRYAESNKTQLSDIEEDPRYKPSKSLSSEGSQTSQRNVTLDQLYAILKEVCLKLNTVKSKLTTLEVEVRDVREIVSTGQNIAVDDADLDQLGLPFRVPEALQKFNKELSVSDFRHSLVKALKVIGGADTRTIVSNLLAKILCNRLAEGYSFKGHKGKTPFKEFFNVINLIKTVVRAHKPQDTDKDIEEAIGIWLSQAKTRMLREEAKMAKRQADEEAMRKRAADEYDDEQ